MKGSFQKETKCPNAEHLGRLCADQEMEVLGLDQNISAIELDERRLANERTNFKRSKMRVNRSKEDMVRGRKVKRKHTNLNRIKMPGCLRGHTRNREPRM